MKIDDFLRLVENRRSIRKFKPDSIPADYLDKILQAARWAMSGANAQPWEFIIIKNPEMKKNLAEVLQKHDEMNFAMELTRTEEFRKPRFRGGFVPEKFWVDAPIVIAVVGDKRTMVASTLVMRYFDHHTFDHNMANVTQMIHLASASLDLGSQWISVDEPMGEEMKLILGIPPVLTIFALVPIGYPANQPAHHRRELKDMVHYEKYDISRFRSQTDVNEFVKSIRQSHVAAGAYPTQR